MVTDSTSRDLALTDRGRTLEMSSGSEAEAAIQAMHGKNMGGRDLTVNIARPMEARPPRSGGYGGGYGDARRNSY